MTGKTKFKPRYFLDLSGSKFITGKFYYIYVPFHLSQDFIYSWKTKNRSTSGSHMLAWIPKYSAGFVAISSLPWWERSSIWELANIVSGTLTFRIIIKIHFELRAMSVHLDQDKFSSTLLNFHLNAACLIQASGKAINNVADSLRSF